MAKLNARGRQTLYTATIEYDATQLQARHDKVSPDKAGELPLTKWERVTRRLMSDRSILEKRDVQFQPDWLDKDGRKHSYGWKVSGKLKADLQPADFARIYREPRKDGSPSHWTVLDGGETPKVISTSRIMRAIRSGESVGFCQACGQEQSNVEPDATGYTCQSCGKPEVYGAEEILMGRA